MCLDVMNSQSSHMQPVRAELKKSQVNTGPQVQTSKYKRDTKTPALSVTTVHLSYLE